MKTTANGLIRTTFLSSLMIAATSGPTKAQTIIEMSALKCSDYLESPSQRQEQFAAWMSGYFNAERKIPSATCCRCRSLSPFPSSRSR
jgi:HdeA/HdeB family